MKSIFNTVKNAIIPPAVLTKDERAKIENSRGELFSDKKSRISRSLKELKKAQGIELMPKFLSETYILALLAKNIDDLIEDTPFSNITDNSIYSWMIDNLRGLYDTNVQYYGEYAPYFLLAALLIVEAKARGFTEQAKAHLFPELLV